MEVYNSIISSSLLDDDYFADDLTAYFPKLMQKNFSKEIKSHQLRREIIATQITNMVVNKTSIAFVNQVSQGTGAPIDDVLRSVIIAIDSLDIRNAWKYIESLDGIVNHKLQIEAFLSILSLLEEATIWLIRNNKASDIAKAVAEFKEIAGSLISIPGKSLKADSLDVDRHDEAKASLELSERIKKLTSIGFVFDVATIASKSKMNVRAIADIYLELDEALSLRWIREKIRSVAHDGSQWQRISARSLLGDFRSEQTRIANKIITNCKRANCSVPSLFVSDFISSNSAAIERFDLIVSEIKQYPSVDLLMMITILGRLKSL